MRSGRVRSWNSCRVARRWGRDGARRGSRARDDVRTAQVLVTRSNLTAYIALMAHYRLTRQISQHCAHFMHGFSSLIRASWLKMFNQNELQLLIGGVCRRGRPLTGARTISSYRHTTAVQDQRPARTHLLRPRLSRGAPCYCDVLGGGCVRVCVCVCVCVCVRVCVCVCVCCECCVFSEGAYVPGSYYVVWAPYTQTHTNTHTHTHTHQVLSTMSDEDLTALLKFWTRCAPRAGQLWGSVL